MIISASRRTDIPAFYSEWFLNRIKERYVLVPNPYNPNMISRVNLDPAVIDCVVFWTKNPAPMIDKLDRLQDYKYYFQFTLNPYGTELESKLPPLQKRIDTFKRLSDKIGREKVVWRYDPILTNEQYTVAFHQDKFAEMAFALHDYTEKCMLGFIDHYPHVRASLREFHIKPLIKEDIDSMVISFKKVADECSMELDTCTTKVDLSHLGISGGVCVDNRLIERIIGYPITARKDKNQRDICRCVESIDIGTYESCLNGCIYCYAIKDNYNTAKFNRSKHDKDSPMLIGEVDKDAVIKEREMKSLRTDQLSIFY